MGLTDAISPIRAMGSDPGSGWDASDFEALFFEHYPSVVATIRRVAGDSGVAEEKAGEVFLKLYERPQLGRDRAHLRAWLYRVAVRAGLDALRADSRRKRYEREAADESRLQAAPIEDLLAHERAERVRSALALLDPRKAQLLLLRHSGFSYREAALALDLNPASVGALLARAEAELARRYRELYPEEDDTTC